MNTISFKTTPSGANVEIRYRTGITKSFHTTPFEVSLASDSWIFIITKSGYRTRSFTKTIASDEVLHEVLQKEDPALEPIHNYTITTVPSGAAIQILKYRTDRILYTGISPATFRLRRGNYDKRIVKTGFRTVHATFIAHKDETRNITLLPLDTPMLTTLEVFVNVVAEITVISSDGRKQTATGTHATFKIPRGRTQITARAEGYGAYSVTRDIITILDTVRITLDAPVREPPGREPPGREPPGREPPGREPPGREPPGREPPGREPPIDWLEENKTIIIIVAIIIIIIIFIT